MSLTFNRDEKNEFEVSKEKLAQYILEHYADKDAPIKEQCRRIFYNIVDVDQFNRENDIKVTDFDSYYDEVIRYTKDKTNVVLVLDDVLNDIETAIQENRELYNDIKEWFE